MSYKRHVCVKLAPAVNVYHTRCGSVFNPAFFSREFHSISFNAHKKMMDLFEGARDITPCSEEMLNSAYSDFGRFM